MVEPIVAVFARAPVLGEVKTRLARDIGAEAALEAHLLLLQHTLEVIRDGGWRAELWLTGDPALLRSQATIPVMQQGEGDLGARMLAAVESIVARGCSAVIIGCDCPVMSVGYVSEALSALEDGADVVFGPAEDGGYALVAMCRAQPALFRDIAWSTRRVLEQSLKRAAVCGLKVTLLSEVWDVDTGADWRRWMSRRRDGASTCG